MHKLINYCFYYLLVSIPFFLLLSISYSTFKTTATTTTTKNNNKKNDNNNIYKFCTLKTEVYRKELNANKKILADRRNKV